MSLFEWSRPVNCGDTPVATCEPVTSIRQASALRVTEKDTNCEKNLSSVEYPSIPIGTSDNNVEYRSGSADKPIVLPRIHQVVGTSIPSILFQLTDGTVKKWIPEPNCANRKLVCGDNGIRLEEDINSNVFENACIGSYSDVSYIAGAVAFSDCNGFDKLKLVFFPKSELPTTS